MVSLKHLYEVALAKREDPGVATRGTPLPALLGALVGSARSLGLRVVPRWVLGPPRHSPSPTLGALTHPHPPSELTHPRHVGPPQTWVLPLFSCSPRPRVGAGTPAATFPSPTLGALTPTSPRVLGPPQISRTPPNLAPPHPVGAGNPQVLPSPPWAP